MNQKTGLVLEGGAMRGMFTAGVLDVMMENEIKLDGAMGVSAGAVFGCNYKSGQIGRSLRYNMRFCDDPRYCSVESLIRTGDLYGVQFCYDEIPNKLDPFDVKAFKENPMPFYAVCTNVETGKAIHKRLDNGDEKDMEYFRASASMPLVSRIVEVDGYKLLDGGITDSIPLAAMERRGYERNVVVLTQPLGFVKEKSSTLPSETSSSSRSLWVLSKKRAACCRSFVSPCAGIPMSSKPWKCAISAIISRQPTSASRNLPAMPLSSGRPMPSASAARRATRRSFAGSTTSAGPKWKDCCPRSENSLATSSEYS